VAQSGAAPPPPLPVKESGEGCSDVLVVAQPPSPEDPTPLPRGRPAGAALEAGHSTLLQQQRGSQGRAALEADHSSLQPGGLQLGGQAEAAVTHGWEAGSWEPCGAGQGGEACPHEQQAQQAQRAQQLLQEDTPFTSLLGHNEDASSDVIGRMYLVRGTMVGMFPIFLPILLPILLPKRPQILGVL
jgi:hypothetical protein